MFENNYLSPIRNYWFVRSGQDGGEFFEHFNNSSVIAIGHADETPFNFTNGHILTDKNKDEIINAVKVYLRNRRKKPSVVGNIGGQLTRFLKEIKKDDIIVTVKGDRIVAGKVVSDCYYSSEAIHPHHYTDDDKQASEPCRYTLRFNVKWGKRKDRGLVPYNLEKTLRTPLTVAHLNKEDQVAALNHWLFPVYYTNEQIRCTLKIATTQQIQNRQLTRLSLALDELELLSGYVNSLEDDLNNLSISGYKSFVRTNEESYVYTLTAQHLFMSPGYQFLQFASFENNTAKTILFTAVLYSLFNPDAAAMAEMLPPDLPVEEVQHITASIKNKISNFDALRESLSVGLPEPDLSPSNDSAILESTDDGFGDGEAIDDSML
ncbi:hypothetical protein [Vibrio nereis]|uniref:Uncharacterized protein n=1 Tax=Vibrio nereis TaxID=693 RepID=A0A0M0HM81_VIBNE|nr:hypothetical protein [Vibrio nereis]KOO03146.1 hypothetical protein AKJ17_11355 [Vibrio nereis]